MAPQIAARDLTRRAGDVTLLEGVDLHVDAGEVLAVVGPSGAGKSTLLRLLCRLDEPTRGTVLLEGRDIREIAPRTLRRRVAYVAQTPVLFPGTVRDNALLANRLHDDPVDEARLRDVLTALGLAQMADRDVTKLSGGERQRVALARTVLNEPRVLLLDEPTSSLDAETRARVNAFLAALARNEGIPIILVTHAAAEARALADRAIVLEGGRVLRAGPVKEVVT